MTPRTFFTLFLKMLAVYLLINAIDQIPVVFSSMTTIIGGMGGTIAGIFVLLLILFVCAVYIMILYYLVLKTDWVIDKLALDKNFPEEKIELNIHRSTVLTIAVIVMGGLMLIDALPSFCSTVFRYYQDNALVNGIHERLNTEDVLFYGIKGFIGFCMVAYNRHIVNFIEVVSRKKS
jgi:hypothetical protein